MPYCPDCGTEYRPGFDTCADCDCSLVDSPPAQLNTPQPSRKGNLLDLIWQVVTIIGFSAAVMFVSLVLGKPSAEVWGPWLAISVPCVLLFAFGWFVHDWLSPALVWFSWTAFGLIILITGRLEELPATGEVAMALVGVPAALALPVICGIYFGRTKKLYLFLIPLLSYAAFFWIVTQISPAQ